METISKPIEVSNCVVSFKNQMKAVTKEILNKRYEFNTMKQDYDESISDFLVRLKDTATVCEFGILEEQLICDRIVAGVLSQALRKNLLQQQILDLPTAMRICENFTVMNEILNKRYEFNTMKQHYEQNISDFVFQLKATAATCEFGILEEQLICDRIISGVFSQELRQKLLQQQTLNLPIAIKICEESASLADLNADCLMKIFSYLNFFELIAVGETNSTFLQVAKSRLKYKTLDFSKCTRTMTEAANLFRLYGPFVGKLKINGLWIRSNNNIVANVEGGEVDQQFLNLIIRYCSEGALKQLSIEYLEIPASFVPKLTPILKNLNFLEFINCNIELSNMSGLINQCVKLKQLNVKSDRKEGNLPLQFNLTKLEKIAFETYYWRIDQFEFLKTNPQLQFLQIYAYSFKHNETLLNPTLLPNLEELVVAFNNPVSLRNMIESPKLKKITLFLSLDVTAFVTLILDMAARNIVEMMTIKNLRHVSNGNYSKLVDALNGFKSLHILKVYDCKDINIWLGGLAQNLVNLKELYLSVQPRTQQVNLTADLMKFVKNATKLEKLGLFNIGQFSIDLLEFFRLLVAHQQKRLNGKKITIYMTLDGFDTPVSQIDMTNIAFQKVDFKMKRWIKGCGKFVL